MPYARATIGGLQKSREHQQRYRAAQPPEWHEARKEAQTRYRADNIEEIRRKDREYKRRVRAEAKKSDS